MFCRHEWEIIVNEYQEAPILKLKHLNVNSCDHYALVGTKIIILKCVKCGDLDKTVEHC